MTKNSKFWLLSLALGIPFAVLQIQASMWNGWLSLPPTYDDVGYFNDALRRLDILRTSGGLSFISDVIAHPMHSPMYSLMAMLGFAVFGVAVWVPAAVNTVTIIGLLRLLFGRTHALPLAAAILLAIALLLHPMPAIQLIEFRPDTICAIATVCAILTVLQRQWVEGGTRFSIIAALFFSLAFLSKPTTSPMTLAALGGSMGLAALPKFFQPKLWPWRPAAITIGVIILVCGIHFIVARASLWSYIYSVVYGDLSGVDPRQFSMPQKMNYYILGEGGDFSMGRPWFLLWLAIATVYTFLAIDRYEWDRVRVIASASVVLLFMYAVVTFAVKIKSRFLGIVVPAFFFVTMIMMTISLLMWMRARFQSDLAPTMAAGLLCAFALFNFTSPAFRAWGSHIDLATIDSRQKVLGHLVDALASESDISRRVIYWPVVAASANPDTVSYEMYARHRLPPTAQSPYWVLDEAAHRKAIGLSSYAVLFSPGYTQAADMPTSAKIEQVNKYVTADPSFEKIARIDDPSANGYIEIWKRR